MEAEDPIKALEKRIDWLERRMEGINEQFKAHDYRVERWEDMAGDLVKRFVSIEKHNATVKTLRSTIKDLMERVARLEGEAGSLPRPRLPRSVRRPSAKLPRPRPQRG